MQPYKAWLFSDIIEKNKRVFKVPVYQRNYDWSNIQCEKLYRDIIIANERDHKHFTGTIVYIVGLDGSTLNEVLIRWTTTSYYNVYSFKSSLRCCKRCIS